MQLKPGTILQKGNYRIIKTIGQGGFGITYLAEQVALGRKVAIKEFFMNAYCDREDGSTHVSVPTENNRELVESYKQKFVKEAQLIASLRNPHIVSIHDIFLENGTAYYVMEYLNNGSLMDIVKKRGPIPEIDAVKYITQVGDALSYIHDRNILHLDVKPSNILINENGGVVLIDFGISKHYDDAGGQTSTTPVGISKGFAPMEQYQQVSVALFSPATDVYSLGATLFYLLTGLIPPEAAIVYEEGLPEIGGKVQANTIAAIKAAMEPNRKKRIQSAKEFIVLLNSSTKKEDRGEPQTPAGQPFINDLEGLNKDESTFVYNSTVKPSSSSHNKSPKDYEEDRKEKNGKVRLWPLVAIIVAALAGVFIFGNPKGEHDSTDNNTLTASSNDQTNGFSPVENAAEIDQQLIIDKSLPIKKVHYRGEGYVNGRSFDIKRIELDYGEKKGEIYYSDQKLPVSLSILPTNDDSLLARILIIERNPLAKNMLSRLGGDTSAIYKGVIGKDYIIKGTGESWKHKSFSFTFIPDWLLGNEGTTEAKSEQGSSIVLKETVHKEKPILNIVNRSIKVGDSFKIIVKNWTESVKWQSSSPTHVSVSATGLVTGVSEGVSIIRAKCGNTTLECKVTVLSTPKIDKTTISIVENESSRITVLNYNGKTKWRSYSPAIASVNEEGLVVANSSGETDIEILCGKQLLKCHVIVLKREDSVPLIPTSVQLNYPDNEVKNIKWTSDNKYIAIVTDSGIVRAVSLGKVNIIASSGEQSYDYLIEVIQKDRKLVPVILKKPEIIAKNPSTSTSRVVSGCVLDSNEKPIIGAAIIVQGTTHGTMTDNNGLYKISVRTGDVLEFSSRKYRNLTKKIEEGRNTYNVYLEKK